MVVMRGTGAGGAKFLCVTAKKIFSPKVKIFPLRSKDG